MRSGIINIKRVAGLKLVRQLEVHEVVLLQLLVTENLGLLLQALPVHPIVRFLGRVFARFRVDHAFLLNQINRGLKTVHRVEGDFL